MVETYRDKEKERIFSLLLLHNLYLTVLWFSCSWHPQTNQIINLRDMLWMIIKLWEKERKKNQSKGERKTVFYCDALHVEKSRRIVLLLILFLNMYIVILGKEILHVLILMPVILCSAIMFDYYISSRWCIKCSKST